jgi:hypothetical protein
MAAPGPIIVYRANLDDMRLNDLHSSALIRMALVASTYTPDATNTGHSLWASVSANEIAGGTGYTAGGYSLTGTVATTTNGFKLSSGNPTWTASGAGIAAWRYGVLYYLGSLWGMTNPLLGYFLGDSAPADVPLTATGNILTINCPAAGWFDKTEA